jgi:hypothetical protein
MFNFSSVKARIMVKKKTPPPNTSEKTAMGLLCEKLGIPYSLNTEREGTASIRFMTRLKKEEEKEE